MPLAFVLISFVSPLNDAMSLLFAGALWWMTCYRSVFSGARLNAFVGAGVLIQTDDERAFSLEASIPLFSAGLSDLGVAFMAWREASGLRPGRVGCEFCVDTWLQDLPRDLYYWPVMLPGCLQSGGDPVVRHAEPAKDLTMESKKTVIVTGASQGIGKSIVQTLLDRACSVVATSRTVSEAGFVPSSSLALLDGDISQLETVAKVAQAAIEKFGSIDHVVNNAGIFSVKPFTEYTAKEFRRFISVNLEGFIFITQLAVRQMLSQGSGGSVTTVTAALADNPIAGHTGVDSDDHKGRTECDYSQPRERIRKEQDTLQCGCAWHCGYAAAQGRPKRFPEEPYPDGYYFRPAGYC